MCTGPHFNAPCLTAPEIIYPCAEKALRPLAPAEKLGYGVQESALGQGFAARSVQE